MTSSADSAQGSFTVTFDTPLAPEDALRRILDLRQHDRIIPLTRVTPAVRAEALTSGTEFVARTGIGWLGFDDVMRVEKMTLGDDQPQAGATITKHARVIRGTIRLSITATTSGSHVHWHQTVQLPWLPRFAQSPAARVIRLGYRQVLSQLVAAEPLDRPQPPKS